MALYDLPLFAFLDMGDFVGGLMKYLRSQPLSHLTIAGGFGKLSKLAAGHLDLHSKRSQVDPEFLASLARQAGADDDLVSEIAAGGSAGAILQIAQNKGLALGDAVAAAARAEAKKVSEGTFDVEVILYDRLGKMVGRAGFDGS